MVNCQLGPRAPGGSPWPQGLPMRCSENSAGLTRSRDGGTCCSLLDATRCGRDTAFLRGAVVARARARAWMWWTRAWMWRSSEHRGCTLRLSAGSRTRRRVEWFTDHAAHEPLVLVVLPPGRGGRLPVRHQAARPGNGHSPGQVMTSVQGRRGLRPRVAGLHTENCRIAGPTQESSR